MSQVTIKITPQQDKFFSNLTGKYNLLRKGRRFGFTRGAMNFSIEKLFEGKISILWGDTIHANIDRYFERYMKPVLSSIGRQYYIWNAQKKELRTANSMTSDPSDANASLMDFRSADNPENWEGFGYHLIILNEAGIILKDEYLYKNAVLPMMLDFADSKLIAGGVPKGKTIKNGSEHPYYTLSKKAQSGDPRYNEMVFTSYDSAVATKEDIDSLVQDLGGPNHPIVRQEIFAEFIDAVDLPFLHAFSDDVHIGDVQYNKKLPIYLCWDFNVKSTCLIIQFDDESIRVLKEYHQAGIPSICLDIQADFKNPYIGFINGDASGANDNASNETYYITVKKSLYIPTQFRVPKINPRHKASYLVCNYILKHYNIIIDKSCTGLIRDCRLVQIIQQKGKIEIDKSDNTLTHFIDPLRYHLHTEHLSKLHGINLEE
jgi:hypothetical protein